MKKDMIFFADKGLTSTSANHIANMAKEYVKRIQSYLDNIKFYTTSITLLGSNKSQVASKGVESLKDIPEKLKELHLATSLIAWLREAIKARQRLVEEVDSITVEKYMADKGTPLPPKPEIEKALTEDDYYASLNIKERNRYYQLEAAASVIGKYIHPDGAISKSRDEAQNRAENPIEVKGVGRDTIVYNYDPSVSAEEVEEMFFALQKEHRALQAELNKMKFDCEKAVEASQVKVLNDYQAKYAEWSELYTMAYGDLSLYKQEMSAKIRNYKIVIPDSLKEIYDKISNLGK